MNILIDVDNTLTDVLKKRNKLIKAYIKRNKLPYKILDINSTLSAKVANWPIEICREWWKNEGVKIHKKCKAQKQSANVVKCLQNLGHQIYIISARENDYWGDAYSETKSWLDFRNICYNKLIVGQVNKKQAMIDNKIDLIIDDFIGQIMCADELDIKSIIYTTNENKKFVPPSTCVRVNNWKQIKKILINK